MSNADSNDSSHHSERSAALEDFREEYGYEQQDDASLVQRIPPSISNNDDDDDNANTTRKPRVHRLGRLSIVSQSYDAGNKGYLTATEKTMRNMDHEGNGFLTNAQVTPLVEQSLQLREANAQLRKWVMALFGVVLILGVSNCGGAFTAARLAKDTRVDSQTGYLYVKGSGAMVHTIGVGFTMSVPVDSLEEIGNNNSGVCLTSAQLAEVYHNNDEGRTTSIVLKEGEGPSSESARVLGVSHSGASYSHVSVTLRTSEGVNMVFFWNSNACPNDHNHELRKLEDQNQHPAYQEFLSHLHNNKMDNSRKLSSESVVCENGCCMACTK